jgi:hypothetical protein
MGLLLAAPTAASANPLTWNLQNVTLDNGWTLTGSFVYDADTIAYSSWDIGVPLAPLEGIFDWGSSQADNTLTGISDRFHLTNPYTQLFVTFANDLTDAGGTVALDPQLSYTLNPSNTVTPVRHIAGGEVEASPEPATLSLVMVAGLGLWIFQLLRRGTLTDGGAGSGRGLTKSQAGHSVAASPTSAA